MTDVSLTTTSPKTRQRISPSHIRRTVGRLSTTTTATKKLMIRPPILIELAFNQGIITVGWVGQPRHHVVRFVPIPMTYPSTTTTTTTTTSVCSPTTPEDYYRIYAPIVLEAMEWLGNHETIHRRVMISYDYGYYIPTACKEAMERLLLHVMHMEAISFHCTWWTVPVAVPAIQDALIIGITLTGIHCYAYAAGQILPYTFQSCTINHPKMLSLSSQSSIQSWQQQLQYEWLTSNDTNDENHNNIIPALMTCLQACPRGSRRAVIHNIWLVGNSVLVDIKGYTKLIAKTLKEQLLKGNTTTLSYSESNPITTTTKKENDTVEPTTNFISTQLPIAQKELQPLASYVSALMVDSSDLTWLGASRWAQQLHDIDPDSQLFQWKFASSSTTTTTTTSLSES